MLCWRRCSGGSRCCRKGWRSSGAPLPSISPPTSMMKLPHLAPPSSGTKPYLKHQIPLSGIESDFFFFYFFCLVVCLFIHFFSLVYPQRSSVNALHFPHVYFHKPVYVSTSSYICYLFWHVSEVAVIQFVAWAKVFIYSKVNTSAKKKQKTIFPACACSLRGKCPTVSALFTFKFRLWLTMNSKYTSVYCWCILLIKTLSLTASTWVEKIPIGSSNKFICRVLSGLMTYTICILMEKIKKYIG